MPEKRFELGDYVEVKDRIKLFYELFGQGRLVTEEVTFPDVGDGTPRVMVKALAYRSDDDPHPGVGYSWIEVPGKTPYTKGSEVENAETSAWGRAIGSLGILIDRSIASANEVENKRAPAGFPEGTRPPVVEPNVETEELVGIIERGGTVRPGTANGYKLEARQGPNGHVIGFRLEIDGDKNIPQVVVEGDPGEALFLATSQNPESLIGHRIDVKGRLHQVRRPGTRGYYRLHVTEWRTKDYRYPAEELPAASVAPVGSDQPPEAPPDDISLFGEDPAA